MEMPFYLSLGFLFLHCLLLVVKMFSKDKSHSVSNILRLQGFGESFSKEVASPDLRKVKTSFQEAVRASRSASLDAPTLFPSSSTSTILTITLEEVYRLQRQYCFLSEIHMIAPYSRDWVISRLLS